MQQPESVAIFWDYGNLPANSNLSGYDLVDNIRSLAQAFGSVILFKAYLDVATVASSDLRMELRASGVALTDCPNNGRKDMADKMLITDMIAFAIDHPSPATIFLISGDRDYAYAVATLRLRRYQVVVTCPSSAHKSLLAQASVHLDWNTEVLQEVSPREPPADVKPPAPPTSASSRQRANSILSRPYTPSVTSRANLNEDDLQEDFTYESRSYTYPSSMRVNGIVEEQSSRYAPPSEPGMSWRQTPRSTSRPYSPPGTFLSAKSSPQTPPERRSSEPVFVTHGKTLFESSSKPSLPEGFPFLDPEPVAPAKARPFVLATPQPQTSSMPTAPTMPSPPAPVSLAPPFIPRSQRVPPLPEPELPPALPLVPKVADMPTRPSPASAPQLTKPTTGAEASTSHIPITQTPAPPTATLPKPTPAAALPKSTPTVLTAAVPPQAPPIIPIPSTPKAVPPNPTPPVVAPPASSKIILETPKLAPATSAIAGPSSGKTKSVPIHFKPLIEVLEARSRGRGTAARYIRRTEVGSDLSKHKSVYKQAGVSKFASYVLLAEEAGIVDVGGDGNDAWVALRPEWTSSTTLQA